MDSNAYYSHLAAAMVRGALREKFGQEKLFQKPLEELTETETNELIELGLAHKLKLQAFLRTNEVGYIAKIMGYLRGIKPDSLLDIGSGRGTFLWRILEEHKLLPITAVEMAEHWVQEIRNVYLGGVQNLKAKLGNAENLDIPNEFFDVTTALDLLPHTTQPLKVIQELCRVTKRFIIISIHSNNNSLFEENNLRKIFESHHVHHLKFETMANYSLIIARK